MVARILLYVAVVALCGAIGFGFADIWYEDDRLGATAWALALVAVFSGVIAFFTRLFTDED